MNNVINAYLSMQSGEVQLVWNGEAPKDGWVLFGSIVPADEKWGTNDQEIKFQCGGKPMSLTFAQAVICAQEGAFGLTWLPNPRVRTLADVPCPPIPQRWESPEEKGRK